MPPFTQTWGVVIEPIEGKLVHQHARQAEILDVFARRLSAERVFLQRFHPSLGNWLPFYWRGFAQTSKVTYLLDDLTNPERIWHDMRENLRREIRKAEKRGVVVLPCESDVVIAAMRKTYARQGLQPTDDTNLLRRLYAAAQAANAGQCFAAQGADGNVNAAAVLVWDQRRAYYLAGGGDPELRTSGATSLLMWHMIQFAAARSAAFDFEGSHVEPIERFFRAFGARQMCYHQITKMPRWMRAALVLAGKL
jgi:hypothetical protein